ncbi:hypothetical protein [Chitinophaga filiformis]|uniref:DoxX protein n=1 Tax=Chitinophaga filiformis TaxID=104663 RepID=A0A1G7TSK7_CHIFI|nr:hypothetical protein [Chitinophaga filiformis]SDG37974.1 hypothetical protein SAMN04488121_10460 [Chitinophaga filiformis]
MTANKWTPVQQALFRFCFIFFILSLFPSTYRYSFSMDFTGILMLATYRPPSLPVLLYMLPVSAVGATIWMVRDNNRHNMDMLYYWLRVILRYRLALAFVGYGFVYFFHIHSPYPSISHMNTHYGEFTRWKIFSMTLGVAPGYSCFLGIVQLTIALLLLFRKLTLPAVIIAVIFLGNVFLSNWAYEGADVLYSAYLLSIASFLLIYDLTEFHTLFALQRPAALRPAIPSLKWKWAPRSIFLLFFLACGYASYSSYRQGTYQFPHTSTPTGLVGFYDVSSFTINGRELPYSLTDTMRWENVVFEKWATVSIRSPQQISIPTPVYTVPDLLESPSSYEQTGNNGRCYYSLQADTIQHTLALLQQNNMYIFHYHQPDSNRIVLSGINQQHDSLLIVLRKINKRYLLEEAGTGKNNPAKL